MRRKRSIGQKVIISVVSIFVFVWILMGIGILLFYRQNMEKKYMHNAYYQAYSISRYIDGDRIKAYQDTLEKDDYYQDILRYLIDSKAVSKAKYMYVVVPREKDYLYIWDAGDPAVDEGVCDLGDSDEYYQDGEREMKAAFERGGSEQLLITNNDEYGYVASAFVAIYDSSGQPVALSSVDLSMDVINSDINRFLFRSALIMAAILLVASVVDYQIVSVSLLKPIKQLSNLSDNFVSEQMQRGEVLRPDIHTGDEIEGLADSLSSMSMQLRSYMVEFERITKEKERVSTEMNIAREIQANMLPRVFPPYPDRDEFDIYASMTPAKEVGGDFYDFFLIDEDHLALVIADVSGKGVPAALFMVIAKIMIKDRTLMGGTPGQILTDVNARLSVGNETGYFVTVWLAVIEISTGKGIAANAGHEHPALSRKDGSYELVKYRHSPAVATMNGLKFRDHEFELGKGDSVFVYTDGLPEATDLTNEMFGTDRMIEALNRRKGADTNGLLQAVKEDVEAFVGDAPQFDDLTMLAFEMK
ncbi:MAG: SpoIIE family protein phosphatase [Lachnospiraceae bacterium]|nr:SpoIIE family protein phosphatase [Lachnospiraceae bacterium]